ncbi:MAG: hypothetical protein M4D80_14180 [Myxococcota bacterium]|nr:hypothetical protein [Myxococcota bacterium]
MRWLAAVLVAACGARPAPPAPAPAKVAVVAPPAPAPITCGDAGVILRGKVEDDRDAGPMKEEAIAKACLHDKWPAEVLDCVGSTPNAKTCLDKLASAQRKAYRERIARWNDAFPEEVLDDETLENLVDFVDCANAVGDPSQYAPVLTLEGEDRELAITMRRTRLLVLCEDWSTDARRCFQDVKQPERCRTLLEPDQKRDVIDRIAEVDAVMAKVAATKPPTCKKLVEVHYADARWKGKLEALPPADKKKVIAESRTAMVKACTDERWSGTLRSCIAADGGGACFAKAGSWGVPPSAIAVKTGIPDCDAYGDALRALTTCNQIPRQAVQAMLDAYQQMAPSYANSSAAERTAAAKICSQADSAIRQSARSLGCTI